MKKSFWMVLATAGALFLSAPLLRAEEGGEKKEAAKAEAKDGEFTGTATKTQSGLPILQVGEVRYRLKAGEKAPETVKAAIEKIAKGETSGEYKVKGKVSDDDRGKKWIAAESIDPVEKK
ncbi:MAG: hypothetical protein HY291_21585 [Planctomycetes bacterium]|nr:hypothetical protein [Planctomycetota bacterium]